MNGRNPARISFATLDREKGIPEPPPTPGEEYPLPAWYRSVRDLPLDELGIEDMSKALRQGIHIEHVVPLALKQLQLDPLAGEMYEGELLTSFKSIPSDYWPKHPVESSVLKSVINTVLKQTEAPDVIRCDAEELLRKTA